MFITYRNCVACGKRMVRKTAVRKRAATCVVRSTGVYITRPTFYESEAEV